MLGDTAVAVNPKDDVRGTDRTTLRLPLITVDSMVGTRWWTASSYRRGEDTRRTT